jgi:GcrA cell cycle regulator
MTDAVGSWTEERVESLKRLWAEGLSASQIAAKIGGGVTRNAVIGKVHRLGLSGRVKPNAATQPQRPRKTARPPSHPLTHGAPAHGNAAIAAQAAEPAALRPEPRHELAEEVAVPMSERVTIMELRDSMCRWPLGDPTNAEFRFCGARAITSLPYCAHHARIAYQPAADRKRDRRIAIRA